MDTGSMYEYTRMAVSDKVVDACRLAGDQNDYLYSILEFNPRRRRRCSCRSILIMTSNPFSVTYAGAHQGIGGSTLSPASRTSQTPSPFNEAQGQRWVNPMILRHPVLLYVLTPDSALSTHPNGSKIHTPSAHTSIGRISPLVILRPYADGG